MSALVGEHFFWITSRAAGIAALLASSAAVALGLMMSGRVKTKLPDLRVTHEALSLATLVALAVHAVSLLGDGYLKPSLADITIPLVSSYERLWMSAGIVGGWMLAILGLSYYFRGRIGPQRWRKLHRFTALAWVLGVAHALGQGTDAGTPWFLLATGMVVLPTAALLIRRLTPAQTAVTS